MRLWSPGCATCSRSTLTPEGVPRPERTIDAHAPRPLPVDECGATAIEYGLIISLIFLVIVSSLTAFGNVATQIFNTAMNAISSVI